MVVALPSPVPYEVSELGGPEGLNSSGVPFYGVIEGACIYRAEDLPNEDLDGAYLGAVLKRRHHVLGKARFTKSADRGWSGSFWVEGIPTTICISDDSESDTTFVEAVDSLSHKMRLVAQACHALPLWSNS